MATRTTTRPAITSQQIAEKAYELYLSRGGEHGRDLEDWLAAESEMKSAMPAKRNGSRTTTKAKAKA